MSGYIGTKSVTLSTTSASVGGDSSVGGDLTVDTNTLYVDSTNNRVGVGTASPSNPFQVGTSDLIVDSSGNVGIGTSSPAAAFSTGKSLDVNGPVFVRGVINAHQTNAGVLEYSADETRIRSYGATSGSGKIIFSNGGGGSADTERMRIDSSGNLLVGATATLSGNKFLVTSDSFVAGFNVTNGTGEAVRFYSAGTAVGTISVTGSSTAYNTSSDYRLKENVTDVTDGITRVKQLEPKRFNFIADPDKTVDGFLAHEAQAVVPEAITGTHNEVDDDGNPVYQGIDQSKLVPLLTAALKESIAKIEALEARVTALEGN